MKREITSPSQTPVQLLHAISCLARRHDSAQRWAESKRCCLVAESAAGVSGHMQTMNTILIFLEDDFVFVAPSFPDHLLARSLSHLYG